MMLMMCNKGMTNDGGGGEHGTQGCQETTTGSTLTCLLCNALGWFCAAKAFPRRKRLKEMELWVGSTFVKKEARRRAMESTKGARRQALTRPLAATPAPLEQLRTL